MRFQLGEWRIDVASGEIARLGEVRRIEPTPMEVLAYLARQPGEVVAKEELLSEVWSDAVVGEESLWRSIYGLRKALDEEPPERRYIETVPRRGYRLVAPVTPLIHRPGTPPPRASPPVVARPATHTAGTGRLGPVRRWGAPAALTAILLLFGKAHHGHEARPAAGPTSERSWSVREGRSAREYFQLGRAFYDGQVSAHTYTSADLDSAVALFDKAVAREPDFALALAELASVRALRAAHAGFDVVEVRSARARATKAVELAPTLPEAHKALGFTYRLLGNLNDAARAFERALELRPAYAAARDGLADVAALRGELATALAARQELLASPMLPAAVTLSKIGWTLLLLDEPRGAEARFREALDHDPLQQLSILGLARLEVMAGDLEAARHRLTSAMVGTEAMRGPDDPVALLTGLGELAHREGSLENARQLLDRATELAGQNSNAEGWMRLAQVELQRGNGERAARLLDGVSHNCRAEIDSGDELWWCRLWTGVAHALNGQHQAAVHWLEEAVTMGFRDLAWLRDDPLLAELRGDPSFERLSAQLAEEVERQRDLAGL